MEQVRFSIYVHLKAPLLPPKIIVLHKIKRSIYNFICSIWNNQQCEWPAFELYPEQMLNRKEHNFWILHQDRDCFLQKKRIPIWVSETSVLLITWRDIDSYPASQGLEGRQGEGEGEEEGRGRGDTEHHNLPCVYHSTSFPLSEYSIIYNHKMSVSS